MIRGEAVKLEEIKPKVGEVLRELKSPSYILERHSHGYNLYSAPGNKALELILEARSLGSLYSLMGKKFDSSWRGLLGGYAAHLPAGKVAVIDEATKNLAQRL